MAVTNGQAGSLLIVGNPDQGHVGHHFLGAAQELGIEAKLCDVSQAFGDSALRRRILWWWDRQPPCLRDFGRQVVNTVRACRPKWVLTTGIAPVDRSALAEIGNHARRINYLTDDPWNAAHRARWFMQALPEYDHIFSPRRANLQDLSSAGCRRVTYLPFGYNPKVHYPSRGDAGGPPALREGFEADVVFVGGADVDRVPYAEALIRSGFRVALYGGYWDHYSNTRSCYRGNVAPEIVRQATGSAKVALCLVRRANRDGHVMRTFEIAAIGGCMLTEYTAEHEEIFGAEGETTLYFRSAAEMLDKTRWLLDHDQERARLAEAARQRIVGGHNTYRDRLESMLGMCSAPDRAGEPPALR
jgi:spore maturation protein CgeB